MKAPEFDKKSMIEKAKKEDIKTIKERIKELLPTLSEEEVERVLVAMAKASVTFEEKKYYAVEILDRARKYIQGYLKDYKIEVEIRTTSYPLELNVKVWY